MFREKEQRRIASSAGIALRFEMANPRCLIYKKLSVEHCQNADFT